MSDDCQGIGYRFRELQTLIAGFSRAYIMSKAGTAPVGTYLHVGEAVTSLTGLLISGSTSIIEVNATNAVVVGSTTRIQIQRRTGLSTFADIVGAYVDIEAGSYSGINSGIQVAIGPGDEISAYVASGSTLSSPVLTFICIPQ